MYEVEQILDHRQESDGSVTYLIKWQGYSVKHNSWEPQENLNDDLIDDYRENLPDPTVEIDLISPTASVKQ